MNFDISRETIEALPKLRFVRRPTNFHGDIMEIEILQQLYKIENGNAGRTEWRDVPTEVEK